MKNGSNKAVSYLVKGTWQLRKRVMFDDPVFIMSVFCSVIDCSVVVRPIMRHCEMLTIKRIAIPLFEVFYLRYGL